MLHLNFGQAKFCYHQHELSMSHKQDLTKVSLDEITDMCHLIFDMTQLTHFLDFF